jgi:hypothetical protein
MAGSTDATDAALPDATLVDDEGVRALWTEALGVAPDSEAGLADVLREEVTARGLTPRALVLRRVQERGGGLIALDPPRIADACDALVRGGDFVLASGGLLAPTPIRAIVVGPTLVRVAASFPTRRLSAILGRDVLVEGRRRSLASDDALRARVAEARGLWLSAADWAGLDRAPAADGAFLDGLDRRLAWEPETGGSLERGGALDWLGWSPRDDGMAWRRVSGAGDGASSGAASVRLWRARHLSLRFVHAWTGGGPPSSAPFVTLLEDEAARARFAVARGEGRPLVLTVRRAAGEVLVEMPGWLPQAEHRRVSIVARPAGDGAGTGRWSLAPEAAQEVLRVLAERLGVRVDETE